MSLIPIISLSVSYLCTMRHHTSMLVASYSFQAVSMSMPTPGSGPKENDRVEYGRHLFWTTTHNKIEGSIVDQFSTRNTASLPVYRSTAHQRRAEDSAHEAFHWVCPSSEWTLLYFRH